EIDVEVDELVREDDEDGTRPGDSRPPAGGGGGGSYPGGGGGGVGTDLASVNGLSVNVTDSVYNESIYNADRRGGKFTFVIPEDINEDDVIKSFEITGSSNAKTLNIGGYSVEFDKGVASATVNEILGDLAPSADGITVKEL